MNEKLIIENYRHIGGIHCWTTSLRNLFSYHNLEFSEEMIFGLGAGVGFMYWYMKMMLAPFIGTRYGKTNSLIKTCQRIGGDATIFETTSIKRGYEELINVLREGEPVFVFADMAYLPYLALPGVAHFGAHSIVVYGLDEKEDKVYVSDAAKTPLIISIEDLKKARSSKYPPYAPKHKILKIKYPIKLKNLKSGITDAIKECIDNYLYPPIKNIGQLGIKKWAGLVLSWPKQFKGLNLFGCLLNTYIFIEESGSGGGGYRNTYAQFLKESSLILDEPKLMDAVKLFEEAGKYWSELAIAALPDSWPLLKKSRELAVEKNKIFEEQKRGALKKMREITKKSEKVMIEAAEKLDNSEEEDIELLLRDIKDKIMQVYEKDKIAFSTLNNIVG